MGRKYCLDRYRPPGDWVIASTTIPVMGVQHRKRRVRRFCRAAESAERGNRRYGVELRPEPNNPVDPNAIAVDGVIEGRVLVWLWQRKWHIGYLGASIASFVHENFISRNIAIAAELYSIYENDDYLDLKVLVLAPPGNSLSAVMHRQLEVQESSGHTVEGG